MRIALIQSRAEADREENLRRALLINDGSWSFLWERGLTLTILVIAALCLVAPFASAQIARWRARGQEATDASAD